VGKEKGHPACAALSRRPHRKCGSPRTSTEKKKEMGGVGGEGRGKKKRDPPANGEARPDGARSCCEALPTSQDCHFREQYRDKRKRGKKKRKKLMEVRKGSGSQPVSFIAVLPNLYLGAKFEPGKGGGKKKRGRVHQEKATLKFPRGLPL